MKIEKVKPQINMVSIVLIHMLVAPYGHLISSFKCVTNYTAFSDADDLEIAPTVIIRTRPPMTAHAPRAIVLEVQD